MCIRLKFMNTIISIIKNTFYYCYFSNFHKSTNTLIFPIDFNKNIDGIKIYDKNKILNLGWKFNQNLDNVIFPEGLEVIELSEYFDKSLDNVKFPSTLKKIIIKRFFNYPLDKVNFPNNFEEIEFTSCNSDIVMNTLPLTLKKLKIVQVFESINLPVTLEKITILYFAHSDLHKLKIPYGCKVEGYAGQNLLNFNCRVF